MWMNNRSENLDISFFVSLHQWKRSGGERAVHPFAQLMMTCESPNMRDKGISIIWEESRSAQRLSNSFFVLVPYPTPYANSKWWDSFKYKLYPTPTAMLLEAPSKKPQGKYIQGGFPIFLNFFALIGWEK